MRRSPSRSSPPISCWSAAPGWRRTAGRVPDSPSPARRCCCCLAGWRRLRCGADPAPLPHVQGSPIPALSQRGEMAAMNASRPIRRALISVSDKSGIVPFARALAERGVALISTGNSARTLAEAGLPVTEVAQVTGSPEMLDGRVKTLHPAIHGGLLARRDRPDHLATLAEHGIGEIDLLVSNLYPFAQTVASGAACEDCVENIDIGGPALIRGAAKNHEFVTVVTDPADYDVVLTDMTANAGATSLDLRRRLARKAYALTASYDAA